MIMIIIKPLYYYLLLFL